MIKFGEILSYNNLNGVEIGKEYVMSDCLKTISEGPDSLKVYELDSVDYVSGYPFEGEVHKYQFARRVYKERVRRPYKSISEFILALESKMNKEIINSNGMSFKIRDVNLLTGDVHLTGSKYCWRLTDLFELFTWADGSTCGVEEPK